MFDLEGSTESHHEPAENIFFPVLSLSGDLCRMRYCPVGDLVVVWRATPFLGFERVFTSNLGQPWIPQNRGPAARCVLRHNEGALPGAKRSPPRTNRRAGAQLVIE